MSLFWKALPWQVKVGGIVGILLFAFVGFRVYVGLERRDARIEAERKEQVARLQRQLKNAQLQIDTLQSAAQISVEVGHEYEKALAATRGDYAALRLRYRTAWNQRTVPIAAAPDAPGLAHDPATSQAQLPAEAVIVSLGDIEQCEVEAGRLSALQSYILRYNEELPQ